VSNHKFKAETTANGDSKTEAKANSEAKWRWLLPLVPVLIVSVIATGIVSLMQSALPLDMVRGGLARAPLSEASSGGLIAWQLLLLMVLQWPIGNWVAKRSLRFGLGMGLLGFTNGGRSHGGRDATATSRFGHGLVLAVLCDQCHCSTSTSRCSLRPTGARLGALVSDGWHLFSGGAPAEGCQTPIQAKFECESD
jgi:hypothetical protein